MPVTAASVPTKSDKQPVTSSITDVELLKRNLVDAGHINGEDERVHFVLHLYGTK